jgi:hypothetical protein
MEQRHNESSHASEMFEKVKNFLASELSQTEFCKQQGLAYWTFRYWLKKYQIRQQHPLPSSDTSQGFIPLRLQPPEPTSSQFPSCVIEFPNGVTVRLSGSIDPALLCELIR